ncbi:hypothetical protein ABEY43_06965 [Priestia megaterium]
MKKKIVALVLAVAVITGIAAGAVQLADGQITREMADPGRGG